MTDALDQLARIIDATGGRVTFDPDRNTTICAQCGAKAPPGEVHAAQVKGTRRQDCRRFCVRCAT